MKNPPNFRTDEARWSAVQAKDPRADGRFFYSVKTTGIYCRPSCTARTPLRKNVAFHASPGAAEQAGFRPCKRCRPSGPPLAAEQAEVIAKVCRWMAESETQPTLGELARKAGMSPFHFHRVFKSITGITPRKYAAAMRARRVRETLPRSGSVTEAIYDAGFNSSGRFYAQADETLGMTPARYRRGGAGAMIRFATGRCSLGVVLVAASERGVCMISLDDRPEPLLEDLRKRFPKARLVAGDREFQRTVSAVIDFIETPSASFHLPLDIQGTAFQQKVWQALQRIPAGSTMTYSELAEAVGAPRAIRAAASACAANKIAVAIPCHRVVRTGGDLSGYRWGVARKRKLLEKERGMGR